MIAFVEMASAGGTRFPRSNRVRVYDADGQRIAQNVGTDSTEYIVSGALVLAEHHGSDWTDFIYAAGQRIVRAASFADRLHISGSNCSNCGSQYSMFNFPNAAGYYGYVIRAGDKLYLRQWQSAGAHGGMTLSFTDGTDTNWAVTDQDGNQLNNDSTQQSWHYRQIDLSQYAGKTLAHVYVMQGSLTAAGPWDIYFDAISLNSADGTVRPIYNGQSSLSLAMSGTSGVSGRSYEINHLSGIAAMPDQTTSYYHTDQISSARLMTSVDGYAVWAATYLPFGYEYNAQPGVNRYKFATYQRDAESGLDYAKFRYYSSSIGRFLSPDPAGIAAVDLMNPQSWNRYGYVGNDPLNFVDPFGLERQGTADPCSDLFFAQAHPLGCGAQGGRWEGDSFDRYQREVDCAFNGGCPDPKNPQSGTVIWVYCDGTMSTGAVKKITSLSCGVPDQAVDGSVPFMIGDTPVSIMGQQLLQGNRQGWRNASGAANTALVATGAVVAPFTAAAVAPYAAEAARLLPIAGVTLYYNTSVWQTITSFLSGATPGPPDGSYAAGAGEIISTYWKQINNYWNDIWP